MLAMVLWVTVAAPVENGELTRARTLYSEMHYEAALKALVKAITSAGLTPQDRAQVYFYTGLCRHQAGDEGHGGEQGGDTGERRGIAWSCAVEHRLYELAESQGRHQPESQSESDDRGALPQDHAQDILRAGPERHPDSDFARPLGD